MIRFWKWERRYQCNPQGFLQHVNKEATVRCDDHVALTSPINKTYPIWHMPWPAHVSKLS
jgi:hypothetical protein